MGRETSAHLGGGLTAAAQACGLPPDQQLAPLPADADPDRAWIEEGLRRALAQATMGELSALAALLAVESGPGALATSLYDDPAAGLCSDAPAGLDEHPEHGL